MNSISTTLLVVGAAATVMMAGPSPAKAAEDDGKVGGFIVGCQAWTFKNFSVFEAIEKTAAAGGKAIEFYPGQKLSPAEPNVKFDHNASPEVIAKVKAKLAEHKIRPVNYGVVNISTNEVEARKVFEFAKEFDLIAVTTESVNALDTIEPLVKEYAIKVGIHEHPRRPNDPNYMVWDPNYVLSVIRDRDPRIGAAADTGHWATSDIKPIDALKILEGRIVSLHLKDRTAIGRQTPDVVYGTGILDIGGILDELKRQSFTGNISIEYEANWDNSVPDVAQCVGFIRGHGAKH